MILPVLFLSSSLTLVASSILSLIGRYFIESNFLEIFFQTSKYLIVIDILLIFLLSLLLGICTFFVLTEKQGNKLLIAIIIAFLASFVIFNFPRAVHTVLIDHIVTGIVLGIFFTLFGILMKKKVFSNLSIGLIIAYGWLEFLFSIILLSIFFAVTPPGTLQLFLDIELWIIGIFKIGISILFILKALKLWKLKLP